MRGPGRGVRVCYSLPVATATAEQSRLLEEVRSRLSKARRVFVLTGAGLIPAGETPAFDLDSPLPFFEDPLAVWRWYDEHRARLAGVRPNAAHQALTTLESRMKEFTLATEGIDGLHRLAGSRSVLELRGNLWVVRCTRCGMRSVNRDIPIANPPSCPICTGLVRPGILWQGEHVPQELLVNCFEALSQCEVFIVAGTSVRNTPAALFAGVARKAGAFLVEISPVQPVGELPVNALLIGPPEEILPLIVSS